MRDEVVVLIAEDDDGHAALIERNLRRAGIENGIERFVDGQAVLDFLFRSGPGPHRAAGAHYLLLLDIRMPKVDGIEVLSAIKGDAELRALPVIMLTTMDDPKEIERCHRIGCSHYITKPIEYAEFVGVLRQLGLFLVIVKVPELS